jgi:hypothetical protein
MVALTGVFASAFGLMIDGREIDKESTAWLGQGVKGCGWADVLILCKFVLLLLFHCGIFLWGDED